MGKQTLNRHYLQKLMIIRKRCSKITIDCALMVNKGLEVIEAHHLFNLDYQKIETVWNQVSDDDGRSPKKRCIYCPKA